MDVDSITIRVNARPTEPALSDLCESVGWKRFGEDFVALRGYALTTSAWTSDGMLIAWTSVVSDNVRHAFLLDVMVHPAFQKKGIGRAVVLRAIEEMRERGVTAFHVDCAQENALFYEKCGFKMGAGGWMDLEAKPKSTTTVLRASTVNDIPFMTQVFLDSLRESITAARGTWDPGREVDQFRGQLDLNATNVIACNGIDVGFITTPESERQIQIHTLCISPSHQSRGIGTEITRTVIARGQATHRAVVLSVLKANPRARTLYERLGFQIVGESEHHYQLTHNASREVCVVVETNQPAVAAELAAALGAWNEGQAGPRNTERFTLSVRGPNGELLGGLVGEMFWNCLYISVLWVTEGCRGKGYGTALMNRAEEIAKARPCDVVFLTTMTFQAPQFYERRGYTRFAELDAAPKGFNRIWFTKRLNFV